jgi:hypothetical protein
MIVEAGASRVASVSSSKATRENVERLASRTLSFASAATAIFLIGCFAWVAFGRARYPFDLEWMEGRQSHAPLGDAPLLSSFPARPRNRLHSDALRKGCVRSHRAAPHDADDV